MQSLYVDLALEINYFLNGPPVINPPPSIKFRHSGCIQTNTAVRSGQSQQKPPLLLADTHRMRIAPNKFFRQLVTYPSLGTSQDFNIPWLQAHLFLQLSIHSLFQGFVDANAALRKLPTALPRSPPQKDLTCTITEDNSDIRPETVRINIIHSNTSGPRSGTMMLTDHLWFNKEN